MLRIALIGGPSLVMEGLKGLVAKQQDMQLVGSGPGAVQDLSSIVTASPSLLVIDANWPLGLTLTAKCAAAGLRVLMLLNGTRDDEIAAKAMAAGATGVVPADVSEEEVVGAIHDTAMGRRHLSPSVLKLRSASDRLGVLSNREREIFVLLVKGLSNVQIAQALYISTRTVETHRGKIYRKLGVHSIADLVHAAYRDGILGPPHAS